MGWRSSRGLHRYGTASDIPQPSPVRWMFQAENGLELINHPAGVAASSGRLKELHKMFASES
jgi:hypothetical protein